MVIILSLRLDSRLRPLGRKARRRGIPAYRACFLPKFAPPLALVFRRATPRSRLSIVRVAWRLSSFAAVVANERGRRLIRRAGQPRRAGLGEICLRAFPAYGAGEAAGHGSADKAIGVVG